MAHPNPVTGTGTKDDPWVLATPPGTSSYTIHRDEGADPPVLVCRVGKTTLTYLARAIDDLHAYLKERGDWMPLGGADEQKPAAEGTVEAWGRSPDNPVGGWSSLSNPGRYVALGGTQEAEAGNVRVLEILGAPLGERSE